MIMKRPLLLEPVRKTRDSKLGLSDSTWAVPDCLPLRVTSLLFACLTTVDIMHQGALRVLYERSHEALSMHRNSP